LPKRTHFSVHIARFSFFLAYHGLLTCDGTYKEKIIVNFACVLSFVVDMQLLYLSSLVAKTLVIPQWNRFPTCSLDGIPLSLLPCSGKLIWCQELARGSHFSVPFGFAHLVKLGRRRLS
jgi:hypothetical protein